MRNGSKEANTIMTKRPKSVIDSVSMSRRGTVLESEWDKIGSEN